MLLSVCPRRNHSFPYNVFNTNHVQRNYSGQPFLARQSFSPPSSRGLLAFASAPVVRTRTRVTLNVPFYNEGETKVDFEGTSFDEFYHKYACMVRALFRPSPLLENMTDTAAAQLHLASTASTASMVC